MKKGSIEQGRRGLSFATPQLTHQIRRFIAARFFLYLGAMCSYFIGVMGTLTFSMGAGVGDNAIAVGLLNLCIVIGQIRGGALLDRIGPRVFFRLASFGLIMSGLLYQVVGTSIAGVFLGAAVFGVTWGIADTVPRAFPAYFTADLDELKRINALVTLTGNLAIVIGPIAGGAIALVAPTQAVFLFMVACAAISLIPGWGIEALREPEVAAGSADEGSDAPSGSVSAGFSAIFGSKVLTLLFWATMLSFMGYGAFDPLESLFYRDVLKVGAAWMGWLSALSGVGGLLGAAIAGVLPPRLVNVRALLVVLFVTGAGSLLYVATPHVLVACAGQFILGVAFSAFGPIKDTLVQIHTPLDRIGRVTPPWARATTSRGPSHCSVRPLLLMSWACREPLWPPGCWWSSCRSRFSLCEAERLAISSTRSALERPLALPMGAAPGELVALATTAWLGGSRRASNGNVARPQLVPVPKCAATTERMQHGENWY